MYYIINEDYLAHHGIKGQRWGVRRFQNYDGTYTKKGLQRYNEAEKKYLDTKNNALASKEEIKSAKKDMKKAYKQLKKDWKADEGKKLYEAGSRIRNHIGAVAGAEVGAHVVGKKLQKWHDKNAFTIDGDLNLDSLDVNHKAAAIHLVGVAASQAIAAGIEHVAINKTRKLHQYYKHEKMYENGKDYAKKILNGTL